MGYRGEKQKIEKKIGKVKRIVFCVVALFLVALSVFSAFFPPATWKYYFSLPPIPMRKTGEMRLHFIDVGQGDCTFIELPDGKTMLIDGGPQTQASELSIMRYLKALNVRKIDYLVVSHADIDHVGGLKEVVENISIARAFLPKCNVTENAEYAAFYAELMQSECEIEYSMRKTSLSSNVEYPYVLQFLYPYTYDVEFGDMDDMESNELSSVLWLDYQGISTLFTGDAPAKIENNLIRDSDAGLFDVYNVELTSTEILKVAHHGSSSSTTDLFARYLGVKDAVVSCGENNDYNHPSTRVQETLSAIKANLHRTDLHGSIMITIFPNGTYQVERLGK